MSNLENPVVESTDIVTPVEQEQTQVENQSVETTQETPAVESKPTETEQSKLTQEEFNKVYFAQKQAERELAALKAQLNQPSTPTTNTPSTTELVKPTLEQFEYDEDAYREALIDYKVELKLQQKEAAQVQTQQATAQKTQAEQVAQSFNDKCVAFEESNPDYAKALNDQNAVQFTNHVYAQFPHIAQAVLESEFGAQLDFHLLTNPQDADRLSKMSPMNAIKELGKLEMKYTTPSKPTEVPKGKVISDAPEPITQVTGNTRSSNDNWRYDDSISIDEYARRDAEERKAKAGRK